MNKELISDLLLPHARPTFPYSTGQCYLQNRLAGTGDNGKLLDILPNDTHDSNKDPDSGDEPRPVHKSHSNDVECTSNRVRGLSYTHSHGQADVGVTNILINSGQSPGRSQTSQLVFTQDGEKASDGSHIVVGASNKCLDGGSEPMNLPDIHDKNPECIFNSVPKCSSTEQTKVRISNMDIAPDQSLARLQRSKSRQKALELRTSGKATKSRLNDENKRISFGGAAGVALYGIDPEEPDHYNDKSILDKSTYTNKGSSGKRVASRDLSNNNDTSNNCGRIIRSRSTCLRPSSEGEPSKQDIAHDTMRKYSGKENSVISQPEGIDLSMEDGTSGCDKIKRSKSSSIQHICPNESLEIRRTSTVEYEDGGRLSQLMDYDHQSVSKEIEATIPFRASEENSDKREEDAMKTSKVREQESSNCMGSMTRSINSSRQHSSVNDLLNDADIPEVDGGTHGESTGELHQQLYEANEVLEVVEPSPEVDCMMKSLKNTCNSNKLVSSAKSLGIADLIVTDSRSGAPEEDPLVSSFNRSDGDTHKDLSGSQLVLPLTKSGAVVNQEEKVPSAKAIDLKGDQPCLGSNEDYFNIRTESEGLVVRLASDAHLVVKPKQLDFNVLEECTLDEHSSLPSVKRSPEQYLQRTCPESSEPGSLENSTSVYPSKVSLEMQLSEACKEENSSPKAYVTNMEECNENKTTLEAYTNGNYQVNHAEDGSEVGLPSDLHKGSYLDMHQPNCHLTEGCAEQQIDEVIPCIYFDHTLLSVSLPGV